MTTTIDSLRVKGAPAPTKSGGNLPLNTSAVINRPVSNFVAFDRTYQFVLKEHDSNAEMTITGLSKQTAPVRKMEHLTRVRKANKEMTTMDSPFVINGDPDAPFYVEKPHFVLCGLPVGSKDIHHHLYVNEARVGNFKTSAKALYQARRTIKSSSDAERQKYTMPEDQDVKPVPPIPPTTPVCSDLGKLKTSISPQYRLTSDNQPASFHGTIPIASAESLHFTDLPITQKKITLLRRENTGDSTDFQREHSNVSTRSSLETVKDSVVNNSLTVTTGKRAKFASSLSSNKPSINKVNYNNPYRNTKYKERMALAGNERLEFNSLDSYFKYQKQQNLNGRHVMTPRAILRIPKPCSDTFLLQMMYDLNRPKSRKSGLSSAKYSDIAKSHDFEELVQTRTSSSLSKAQSSIEKFMARKSGKSSKSTWSALDTEIIEEEANWDTVMNS